MRRWSKRLSPSQFSFPVFHLHPCLPAQKRRWQTNVDQVRGTHGFPASSLMEDGEKLLSQLRTAGRKIQRRTQWVRAARFGFSCQRCPAFQAPHIPRGARVAPGGNIALALARRNFLITIFLSAWYSENDRVAFGIKQSWITRSVTTTGCN